MGLFAIADLHLSLGKNKPMCIFKGWENHAERLKENWNKLVGEDDTVVIAGDISWATELTDAVPDLLFIDEELKGKKIILKGNHDYWWTSLSKLKALNLKNIDFLHNNAFLIGDIAVCGTRGWLNEEDKIHCEKLQKREALRLEASIKQAKALNASEIYAFLHYSPAYGDFVNFHITDVLQSYGVKYCFYGHLHGGSHKNALLGKHFGIEFSLISADFIEFSPKILQK